MKTYEHNGSFFQFEEGKQPEGYVEVKSHRPKNKARKTADKSAEAEAKAAAEAEAAAKAEAEAKAAADKKASANKSKGTTKAE